MARWKAWKRYLLLSAPLAVFLGLSVFFYVYATPEEMILWIGVENAYLLMGILGFLSGAMTFSGIPYHLILIAFATGGLNPLFLALATTAGLALGDSLSYLLGYHSAPIVPERFRRTLDRVRGFSERYPKLTPLVFFLYGALSPFSNDFIGITMGLARYSYWRVMAPLSAGTVFFNLAVAYFGSSLYGYLLGG